MHAKTLFILLLTITLCGCDAFVDTIVPQPEQPDENPLVGVWTIETIDGQTLEMAIPQAQELADFFDIWTFYRDGRYERLWGWTPAANADGVFVSPPLYFSIDGTYSVEGSQFAVTVENSTFFGDVPNPGEEQSGTWVRDRSTLTLAFDDGTVIVLKAKV